MLRKQLCFFMLLLLTSASIGWGETQVSFTPVVAATYTTDDNVFSEKEKPLAVHSYELIPSAELGFVFGKSTRFSLLYRYSGSQYLSPRISELRDKAEKRGLARESVVEFRNSGTTSTLEYCFGPSFSVDVAARYDVSGIPSYKDGYFNHLGVTPGLWITPVESTSLHLTYLHNRYYYPLKIAAAKDVHQEELESGGAVLLVHKIFPPTRIGLAYQYAANDSNDNLADYRTNDEFLNLWQDFGQYVSLQVTGQLRQRAYRTYLATDTDVKRRDNLGGLYNYLSLNLSKYFSLNFGYDSLANKSNYEDAQYNRNFYYCGLTITPGSFKTKF